MTKKLLLLLLGLAIVAYLIIVATIFIGKENSLPNDLSSIDYVIVLGAKVEEDRSLSSKLEDRLDKTIEYFKNEKTEIIVSGGQGADEPATESSVMKEYLIENGIDENRIIEENKATSTYENLIYSKEKIDNFTESDILIVTNSYHLARVKMLSSRLDYNNVYFLGTTNSANIKDYARETLAIVKSFIFDR